MCSPTFSFGCGLPHFVLWKCICFACSVQNAAFLHDAVSGFRFDAIVGIFYRSCLLMSNCAEDKFSSGIGVLW